MIDKNFIKRIQSAVNRDKALSDIDVKICLSDVRDHIYEHWTNATAQDERSIVSELVGQIVQRSSKLATIPSDDDFSKEEDEVVDSRSAMVPHKPENKSLSLNKQEFMQLAEQEFANEPQEIKDEIVNHLLNQSIRSARGLRSALAQIRNTELNLFRKTYSDHLASRREELNTLRESLQTKAQEEESDEVKFQNDLTKTLDSYMKEFGLV